MGQLDGFADLSVSAPAAAAATGTAAAGGGADDPFAAFDSTFGDFGAAPAAGDGAAAKDKAAEGGGSGGWVSF